jgi:hypothetical protein
MEYVARELSRIVEKKVVRFGGTFNDLNRLLEIVGRMDMEELIDEANSDEDT